MSEETQAVAADVAASEAATTAVAPTTAPDSVVKESLTTETAPAAAETPAAEVPPTSLAPEKYDFAVLDGVVVDTAVLDEFSSVAKELGMSQEAASKIYAKVAPKLAQQQQAQHQANVAEWQTQATADKEFGGEKLSENMAVAKKALDAFGTPELKTLLNDSGLGNHPEIIRAFYRAGLKISESNFVPGGASSAAQPKSAASILYKS